MQVRSRADPDTIADHRSRSDAHIRSEYYTCSQHRGWMHTGYAASLLQTLPRTRPLYRRLVDLLEDAVVPDKKDEARGLTRTMLGGRRGSHQLYVRVNALDTRMTLRFG